DEPTTAMIPVNFRREIIPLQANFQLQKEVLNGARELLITVAGAHVAGAADIDIAGVRHQLEEILGMLLLHQLGGGAAHQQGRDADAPRGINKALLDLVGTGAAPTLAVEKPRVPMPAPAPVRMQPQVLLQPLVRAW